jgi:hypothetical protein
VKLSDLKRVRWTPVLAVLLVLASVVLALVGGHFEVAVVLAIGGVTFAALSMVAR